MIYSKYWADIRENKILFQKIYYFYLLSFDIIKRRSLIIRETTLIFHEGHRKHVQRSQLNFYEHSMLVLAENVIWQRVYNCAW